LVVEVEKDIECRVGRLGVIKFNRGLYIYVGSAQNSMEKRIKRHLSKNKKLYWHIDYLLESPFVRVREALYNDHLCKEWECKIASLIDGEKVPRFGSSDCKCDSHLIKVEENFLDNMKKYFRRLNIEWSVKNGCI